MGPDVTARLHGVEKSLHRLFVLVEVVIHPQTRMVDRLGGDAVQKRLVNAADVGCHGVLSGAIVSRIRIFW
jgi:hypothetical protein